MLDSYDDICVISFDLPCHGKDVRQKLSLNDCMNYYSDMLSYIYKVFNPENIYLNATSFGGYLGLKYISENPNPFRKIVLRCPAINMYEILNNNILNDESLKALKSGKSILVGFDKKMRLTPDFVSDLKNNDITKYDFSNYSEDIMIFQGTHDELVSFEKVKEFANKNGIEFIDILGADHMFHDPKKMNEFIEYATDFLLNEDVKSL